MTCSTIGAISLTVLSIGLGAKKSRSENLFDRLNRLSHVGALRDEDLRLGEAFTQIRYA